LTPSCQLDRVGQYAVGQLNSSLRPGVTINSMPWPAISSRWRNQTIGSVDFAVALENNPAVQRFLRYLASARAATIWASAGRVTGSLVSPNRRVPRAAYANLLVGNEAHEVATAADFHFDGSDQLPDGLADVWATTLQNVIRHPAATKQILARFQHEADKAFSSGG
jgi:alpha-glucoside transport system substrate-binding protein